MHSTFESLIVSALSPCFAKYFSLWALVTLTWWSTEDDWGASQCGTCEGRGDSGLDREGISQDWWVLGMAQEADWGTEEEKPREVTHVFQQGQAGRGWPRVTGGAWLGWAYTCVLNLGSMHVPTSLHCTTSHTWMEYFTDGMSHLGCFYHGAPLTACKRSSVEYSSNTHSRSFMSVYMAAVYGLFFCVGNFLVRASVTDH